MMTLRRISFPSVSNGLMERTTGHSANRRTRQMVPAAAEPILQGGVSNPSPRQPAASA
jgi:hypothetical protein